MLEHIWTSDHADVLTSESSSDLQTKEEELRQFPGGVFISTMGR